jgi:16S rRNA (adenine1518-N6/adenine1519-N6)-dimethyltransferase
VSRGSFLPSPDVDSTVIRLDIMTSPRLTRTVKTFFKVVRAAFSMRRKTILNCLSAGLSVSKEQASQVLERAGVPVSARAEQLSMDQLRRLRTLCKRDKENRFRVAEAGSFYSSRLDSSLSLIR